MTNTPNAQLPLQKGPHEPPNRRPRPQAALQLPGHSPAPAAAVSHQALVQHLFTQVQTPQWFGTIQWLPFIKDYYTATKESKHFRLKLLCALYDTRPRYLPAPPARPRLVLFHERAFVDTNPNSPHHPKYAWTYHTHFHLGACPEPYNTQASLDALIRTRVAPGFSRFSTRCSANHKGLVLLPWVAARHADYNFKDYHTYRQQQDSDLVLDIENSDLRL